MKTEQLCIYSFPGSGKNFLVYLLGFLNLPSFESHDIAAFINKNEKNILAITRNPKDILVTELYKKPNNIKNIERDSAFILKDLNNFYEQLINKKYTIIDFEEITKRPKETLLKLSQIYKFSDEIKKQIKNNPIFNDPLDILNEIKKNTSNDPIRLPREYSAYRQEIVVAIDGSDIIQNLLKESLKKYNSLYK